MLRKNKGHIVTVASMASFVAAPGLLDYCCSKVGALYLSEGQSRLALNYPISVRLHNSLHYNLGIRAECLGRYPGGEGICTTSVHPSWHQTGILKGGEASLTKFGIVPDPPKNVSDLVVSHVLSGKSGRLCVPKAEEGKTGVRGWPLWARDIVLGNVWQRKDTFSFAKK
jgi:all-trans-retinol dehydrogenase (NAD+)